MTIFMLRKSDERLCRRILLDREDVKFNCVDISIQITEITYLSIFEHTKTNDFIITFDGHNTEHSLFQI